MLISMLFMFFLQSADASQRYWMSTANDGGPNEKDKYCVHKDNQQLKCFEVPKADYTEGQNLRQQLNAIMRNAQFSEGELTSALNDSASLADFHRKFGAAKRATACQQAGIRMTSLIREVEADRQALQCEAGARQSTDGRRY